MLDVTPIMQTAPVARDGRCSFKANAHCLLWKFGRPLSGHRVRRSVRELWSHGLHPKRPVCLPLRCCSNDETPLHASSFDNVSETRSVGAWAFHPDASYLKRLYIEDFVLIKKEEVFFDPGFNVVTGESGAGKSVLIEALSQVLGKTSLGNCIRPSCSNAVLEATFHLAAKGARQVRALFRQLDVHGRTLAHLHDTSGGDIVLRREISQTPSGLRSRCFVNGNPISVRVLKAISDVFFDINGQHAVTQLGNKQQQVTLIDRITGQPELQQEIERTFKRMSELKSLLSVSSEFEDEEIRDEAERLCDEVSSAGIAPGEERNLRYTLQVLETHASSVEAATAAGRCLDGGSEAIVQALQEVSSRIKTIVRQEQRNADLTDTEDEEPADECDSSINCALHCLDDALEHIEKAENEIEKAAEDVFDFASFMKFDEVEQSEIRQRLKEVEKLLRSFQCRSSEELLDLAAETQARLDQYVDSCDKRTDWESELASVEEDYIQKSVALSLARREMAGKLRKAIEDCLYDLAMQKSRFDIRINWERTQKQVQGVYVTSEFATKAGEMGDARYLATSDGFDSVEFLLAPGPTEPLRALSAVASGGECARIMLAFKAAPTLIQDDRNTFATKENENDTSGAVLVLDELDTGVGVRLGRTVGRLLRRICTSAREAKNQVICISHLPQVAAYASTHIKATKSVDENGKMEIQFQALKTEMERSEEINAMMGSSENLAYDLLNDAKS